MDLVADRDVQDVAVYMQQHIAAGRLVAVAEGLAALAPILWGQYQPDRISTLRLVHRAPAIADDDQQRQSVSSESALGLPNVDDGSAVAVAGAR